MNFKATSSILHLSKSFLFGKKLMSLFVFVSLSINGFMPSVSEASKYSIVMLGVQMTEKLLVSIIEKCDLSIGDMASEIYCKMTKEEKKGLAASDSEKKAEEGAGEGIKQAVYNKKLQIIKEELPILAGNKNIYAENQGVSIAIEAKAVAGIMIMFLLFIIGIIRRKEDDAIKTIMVNREKKSLGLA